MLSYFITVLHIPMSKHFSANQTLYDLDNIRYIMKLGNTKPQFHRNTQHY